MNRDDFTALSVIRTTTEPLTFQTIPPDELSAREEFETIPEIDAAHVDEMDRVPDILGSKEPNVILKEIVSVLKEFLFVHLFSLKASHWVDLEKSRGQVWLS